MNPDFSKSDFYFQVKYNTFILSTKILLVMSIIATVFHYFHNYQNIIDLIIPPCLVLASSCLLWYLHRHPYRFEAAIKTLIAIAWGGVFTPTLIFTLESALDPEKQLIEIFPSPIFGGILPLVSSIFMFVQYKNWKSTAVIIYTLVGVPVILYLGLHPEELRSTRGTDIAFLFGPAFISNLVLMILAVRSQELINKLAMDRMSYYVDLAERQVIRERSLEQAYTLIHNGPLQTLALLLRESKSNQISKHEMIDRIEHLNAEIRAIGHVLMGADQDQQEDAIASTQTTSNTLQTTFNTLRLADGKILHLDQPLHWLLQEVYTETLQRQLPHFQTVRAKIRYFQPLFIFVSYETKRELCLWLEEALCNVGKHAVGTTRVLATGRVQGTSYCLVVQDNGMGMDTEITKSGIDQGRSAALPLGSTSRRIAAPQGGVICELSWPLPRDEMGDFSCKLPCA